MHPAFLEIDIIQRANGGLLTNRIETQDTNERMVTLSLGYCVREREARHHMPDGDITFKDLISIFLSYQLSPFKVFHLEANPQKGKNTKVNCTT